jgi:glycine/D-amino acid oxidase-like deaminating enzyme
MDIDFLIVGQGLAGSLLAWQLMQLDCKVIIVDNGLENASQVAAGLINPVTGMRLVKNADVDVLLPVAKHYYVQLASFFSQNFYVEKTMLRIFNSNKERDHAIKRLQHSAYQAYLGEMLTSVDPLKTPYGYLVQQQTGYLLTRPLLGCLKDFFIDRACYRQQAFNVADIQFQPRLHWQGIFTKRIVFCEGYYACNNPYFDWLPFQAVKGEILTLNHPHTLPDTMLNYGHWLIPLNNQQIRVGATFDWQNLNNQPTEQGKNSLLNSINTVLDNFHYQLVQHHANVRPCTLDKQPFIGFHPQHPQLGIFNGFGAKGSLQIPWYAQQFTDTLINHAPLPLTCDIQRYV